ncbi:phosphatidylserine decarboxylase proenzyme [Paenibacillus sp. J31TS4]|uniref:archaetidylserine decarboxylase n=1 Tax=Paenibacillus sp. J31TS4 TaxID=2807195 RepID=UPI001B0AE503|nr:archaetidylserine decarboxylase [Paenibacillus sp. J31TS4]GIP39008.1 phosphatidylserine decarboxylase proenzyme [Paenibacillus sp. J31TS4]
MAKPLFRLMTELSSRKTISRITGGFAKSRLSRSLIPWFARTYQIRLEDAEKPHTEYMSLNDFFTRRLKPGLRPVDPTPSSLISPVDALITGMGPIEAGQLLNIKGQDYTIEELLNRSPRMINYRDGFYFVLYLSPTDYHRIHSPVTGTILEKERVSGKVYPVNEFGLRHMKRVLSRNERLITYIHHAFGEVAVVKVGALNVSSIRYADQLPMDLTAGDDLAYFEFGSTVVLLTENGTFRPRTDLDVGSKVQMGERLGELTGKAKAGK